MNGLRGLDALRTTISYKGGNFHDFLYGFYTLAPFEKGFYSKRKEFAPFRVDPISEGIYKPRNVKSLPLHYIRRPV